MKIHVCLPSFVAILNDYCFFRSMICMSTDSCCIIYDRHSIARNSNANSISSTLQCNPDACTNSADSRKFLQIRFIKILNESFNITILRA